MIDTIKIRLPLKEVTQSISEKFHPVSLNDLQWSPKTHLSTRYNPQKTVSFYSPTFIGEKYVINGVASYQLGIEVSLPKLLFGNNVEELPADKDTLGWILEELRSEIYRHLGLKYDIEELLSSEVAKIHVGKNFIFDDPGAPLSIIETISKSKADRVYDNNKIKYENNGSAFKIHANNKDIIFYDKKKDIEQCLKSPKRAIDRTITYGVKDEETPIHSLLFDKSSGVLRLEVRLNNRRYIRQAFPSISDDLSLENVFCNTPIIPYLEREWQKAISDVSLVQLGRNDIRSSFEAIAARGDYGFSLRDSLAVAAALEIIDMSSLNYLRSLIEKYYAKDDWYRFRKKLFIPNYCRPSYFEKIEEELRIYNPIKLQNNNQ